MKNTMKMFEGGLDEEEGSEARALTLGQVC